MDFERTRPGPILAPYIEWYWYVQSDDPTPRIQKIIPDGYPEFIFHYGDPFRIYLHSRWELQGKALAAGQIRKYFHLENTGTTDIFGITFKPTALAHLFQLPMQPLTDKVIPIAQLPSSVSGIANAVGIHSSLSGRIAAVENFLKAFVTEAPEQHVIDRSIGMVRQHAGMISVLSMCSELGITDRQLQRLYNKYVGLSPKYYSRIVRFSTIFTQIKEGKISWADVVSASGYYDQSHFIRDFKSFTGEDPTAFPFREASLTNFFARKTRRSDLSNTTQKKSA